MENLFPHHTSSLVHHQGRLDDLQSEYPQLVLPETMQGLKNKSLVKTCPSAGVVLKND